MKHIIQKDVNDCGIACISMLLENDFKMNLDYYEIRNKVEVEEQGVRLDKLVDYLNKFDSYKAYKCDLNNIPNHPFITIIKIKKYQHYIVVWKKDNKYIYYSNPSEEKPNKMSLHKFKKIYGGVIVYFKERELEKIEVNKKIKIKYTGKYVFPLIILNILEIILFTISFMYLFNIDEFNIFKIGMFFSILTIQIIIYLLKNHFINLINNLLDERLIENNEIYDLKSELKENIKKAFYIKNKKTILYNKIIPYLIISICAFIIFFYLHFLLALSMIIFSYLFYLISLRYYYKKNKINSQLILLENEFNNEENSVNEIVNKIKNKIKQMSKSSSAHTIISLFYRQSIFIFIMLMFSLIKQENFVFIGLYLCFYLLDFSTLLAEYRSDKKTYRYILYSFISKE